MADNRPNRIASKNHKHGGKRSGLISAHVQKGGLTTRSGKEREKLNSGLKSNINKAKRSQLERVFGGSQGPNILFQEVDIMSDGNSTIWTEWGKGGEG